MGKTNCECCVNYVYNEEYEYYECLVNLDEDEMGRFMTAAFDCCPYFRLEDEYRVVKKQM